MTNPGTSRVPAPPATAGTRTRSALEIKLGHHLQLTYAERDALRWLERRERRYSAGTVIVSEGEPIDCLHVVASGWLHGSTRLPDGGRQILRFYFLGDLTTTFSIAWGVSAATLTAVSNCVLYEFPRQALGRLFKEQPRLAGLFYAIGAADQVAMADRLTSVGRTDSATRIGKLLLDIRAQLQVVDGEVGEAFELPLTLQDLGDAVGLTKTHVSRMLRQLEQDGLMERVGKVIRITDVEGLSDKVSYQDRYSHVATDWLEGEPIIDRQA